MNRKALTTLGVVLVVLLGMYLATPSGFESPSSNSERHLFSDISVDAIAKLEVIQGEQHAAVEARDGQWVVPSKGGFRANSTKVKSTLLKLIDLSVSQLVTENEANFASLGVADDSVKAGRTRLAVLDKDGKELGALIIGEFRKKRNDASVLAPQGQYVRRAGDKSVYMVAETIALNANTIDWVDTVVSNILQSQVQSVEQVGAGSGEPVIISKLTEASEGKPATFSLKGLGSGESLVDHKVSQLASGLENLRFNDVYRADDEKLKDLKFGAVTTYYLSNGLNYIAETAQREEQVFLRLRVVFDEARAKAIKEQAAAVAASAASESSASGGAGSSVSEGAGEGSSVPAVPAVQVSTAEDAAKLSAGYSPWIYELPKYLAQKLRLTKAELVQKK